MFNHVVLCCPIFCAILCFVLPCCAVVPCCPMLCYARNAETKDFARLTSLPVRGWAGKNKAFCSSGNQNGRRLIKVCHFG